MGLSTGAIIAIIFGACCCFCCCILILKKRAKARAHLRPKPQENFKFRPAVPDDEKDVPILSGVKVVELATVVAAPTCAYILAELGAEVVKVETQKGDMWRKFFLEYQDGKDDSVVFEIANFGKASVCLDLCSEEGVAQLKKLLAQADVFVCNVRNSVLKKMKIDYNQIKAEFPHLIYAHLSAWGQVGPEKDFPGYDLGAYHAMTGLARQACMQTPDGTDGMFAAYPTAQGDCTSGISMASGILAALRARADHGSGRYVHTSLLATGTWCMGAVYSRMDEDESKDELPVHHPTHVAYVSKDDLGVQLLGLGKEESQIEALTKCLGLTGVTEDNLEAKLEEAFKQHDRKDLVSRFDEAGVLYTIPFRRDYSLLSDREKLIKEGPLYGKMMLEGKAAGIPDIAVIHKFPFQLRSGFHMTPRPAPKLGAHTDDYLQNGFTDLPTAIEKRATEPIEVHSAPFRDGGEPVHVIELPGVGVSSSACGRWLADLGAKVTVVKPAGGQTYMDKNHPKFMNHLNYGKEFTNDNVFDPELKEKIGKAGVFITNMPLSILKKHGLDHISMMKRFPNLIYGLVTMRGIKEKEGAHDVGPFLCESGNWTVYTMANPRPTRPPPQLGEIKAGLTLACAINAALFKKNRTGEGNFCHTSLLRVGVFTAFQVNTIQHQIPAAAKLYTAKTIDEAQLVYPVPTANSYRSSDGVWFQFLGVETPRWLIPFAKAFGIKGKVIKGALYHGIFDVALGSGTFFEKVVPLFQTLNKLFRERIKGMTAKEVEKVLDDNNLWYCYSRPARALRVSEQARTNAFFRTTEGGTVIKNPLEFSVLGAAGKTEPILL